MFNRLVNLQYLSVEHNCLTVYQAGEPAVSEHGTQLSDCLTGCWTWVSEHGTQLSDCLTGFWTCSIWTWNTTVWLFNRLLNLQYLSMEHNCLNVKYQAGEPAVSEHGTQLYDCLTGFWTCSIWTWNTTVWLFNRLLNLQYLSMEHNCLNV